MNLLDTVSNVIQGAFGKSEVQPEPMTARYDGRDVPDLAAHLVNIREAVRKEREKMYPEGFRERMKHCWQWLIGQHWQLIEDPPDIDDSDTLRAADRYIVENRVAEKRDGVIVPALIQHQPTVKVVPVSDGDALKAQLLDAYLHKKLGEIGFDEWNIQLAGEMPTYGSARWTLMHRHDKQEPYGECDLRVLDPLAVAWSPTNVPIEEARIIVHVEEWDLAEAKANFALMQKMSPADFGLVEASNDLTENQWWCLDRYIHTQDTETNQFFPKVLVTWFWLRDSERQDTPRMTTGEEVLPPEAVPAEGMDYQERVNPETGMMERVRQFETQELDEQGLPVVDNAPVYPRGRLTILLGNKFIAYDGENYDEDGEFPYGEAFWRMDREPFVSGFKDDQMTLNRARAQIAWNSRLNATPASLYDKALLDDNIVQEINQPEAKIGVSLRAGQTLENAVVRLDLGDMKQSLFQSYQIASAAVERESGVSVVSTGFSQTGDSGIKVARLDEHTLRRLEVPASSRDITLERVGKLLLKAIFRYDPPDEIVRASIDQPLAAVPTPDFTAVQIQMQQQQIQATLQEIFADRGVLDFDIELQAIAGDKLTPRQQRLSSAMQMTGGAGALPPNVAPMADDPNVQRGAMPPQPPRPQKQPMNGKQP